MPAAAGTAPLGVAALSQPRNLQLAKSSSVPNMQRSMSRFDAGRGGGAGGHDSSMQLAMSRPGGSHLQHLSPKAQMSQSFSGPLSTTGGHITGRMVMQGYWGLGPPKAGAYKKQLPKGINDMQHAFEANPKPVTQFRRFYERGDLPIVVRHGATASVGWKVEPERLDYVYHLPIFFDGLLEKVEPYSFLAFHGLQDMLNAARGKEPSLICPAIPTLIVPIKRAMNTKDNEIMCRTICAIQLLIRCDNRVGELLVPYYRQILPIFNLFRSNNQNLGDMIEYGQRKKTNMGDLIQETLELLERTGGEDAFINIKYMIPTYESVLTN
eukprot:gnl/TRDRNA2_/TRDRNA2_62684_c0_seq1.p1 gnl/TRDRNA2_/TRDRNA2_62684_c0~~gnl/TRDRNA2_/TRDRNA2_62684_c0_seq1.p1  ORF type:complete len:324 (+),score=47.63 gnl/TRDRNA2_/TRDRNA2_62684_c0_seq1:92-1063(+)